MPRAPKHPSVRARANKVAGARTLSVLHDVVVPDLPGDREWLAATAEWWADLWASPMAPEFDASDAHGLFMLAVLVDEFWRKPSANLAGEIRLQRQCFGLSPIDRRRLQWEIDRGEEADESTRRRREAQAVRPVAVEEDDPRRLLA